MSATLRKRLEELRSLIRQADHEYYILDQPSLTDAEYDRLFRELLTLEAEHPEWLTADSPSQRVGHPIAETFEPVRHALPLLSLGKCTTPEEFAEFEARSRRILGVSDIQFDYSCEPKFDGLAVELTYRDGLLAVGSTRGDGTTGENVTANLRTIRNVPLKLPASAPSLLDVRGEVVLGKDAFAHLNRTREQEGQELFANPRNAAAGSVRQLDPKVTAGRPLKFLAYGAGRSEGIEFCNQAEVLEQLAKWGFEIHRQVTRCRGAIEVEGYFRNILAGRDQSDYELDGIVAKVDLLSLQQELGELSRSPRWAIAWKFPPQEVITRIEDIQIQVGRTGVLTPVAHLEPVRVGGVEVRRATLHNTAEIRRKGIMTGDTVIVRRAGDVIPAVVRVLMERRSGAERPFELPECCPICQSPVVQAADAVAVRCSNIACPAQVRERIYHFAARGGMDIEGVGPRIIDQLLDAGLIRDSADLFALTKEDLLPLALMAEKRAQNIVGAIAAARHCSLKKLLAALGIPNVGEHLAQVLATEFGSLDRLMEADAKRLSAVRDVGPITAKAIHLFFSAPQVRDMIARLKQYGVVIAAAPGKADDLPLAGKTFVLTGTLDRYSRQEARDRIERLGGRVTGSVSKKTDFVVTGSDPGAKVDKARSLDVKILSETEWEELLSHAG